jgi:hypothetical protein
MIKAWVSQVLDELTGLYVNAQYFEGETVLYESQQYKCRTTHFATTFISDFISNNWVRNSYLRVSRWLPNVPYFTGDLITYGSLPFICKCGHVSNNKQFSIDLSIDVFNLDLSRLIEKGNTISSFYSSTSFQVNDLVVHGSKVFKCKVANSIDTTIGYGLTTIQSTLPDYGTNWETYWEYQPSVVINNALRRWVNGRSYLKDEIVQITDKLYVCTSSYDGSSNQFIDEYEPFFGQMWSERWSEFSLWTVESTRRKLVPGFSLETPFVEDYISAIDEVMLERIDMPMVKFRNLRNLSIETDIDVLQKSAEMLGFNFAQYGKTLIDPAGLYTYTPYLCQYIESSGTPTYLKFLNFIVNKQVFLDPTIPRRYSVSDTSKIAWRTEYLYTNDYIQFFTDKELLVRYDRTVNQNYLGVWKSINSYKQGDSVFCDGWYWTNLTDTNLNHRPSKEEPSWILTSTIDNAEFVPWVSGTKYKHGEIVYHNSFFWTYLLGETMDEPLDTNSNWLKVDWYKPVEFVPGYRLMSPEVKPTDLKGDMELEYSDIIPLSGSTIPIRTVRHPQVHDGPLYVYEYESGTSASSMWEIDEDLGTSLDNCTLLYINNLTGKGYYKTTHVYLYRTDHKDLIGTNLEDAITYPYLGAYSDITSYNTNDTVLYNTGLYRSLISNNLNAISNTNYWTEEKEHTVNINNTVDVIPNWRNITKLYTDLAQSNHVIYIKEVKYDFTFSLIRMADIGPAASEIEECELIPFICDGSTINYPTPVKIGNWVATDLGTCVTCPQRLFIPVIPA